MSSQLHFVSAQANIYRLPWLGRLKWRRSLPWQDVIAICRTPLSQLSIWTELADRFGVQSASFFNRLRSEAITELSWTPGAYRSIVGIGIGWNLAIIRDVSVAVKS